MAAPTTSRLLADVMADCEQFDRPDLLERLRSARARLTRPSTLVCVVGEYKRGKSTLVNALVGHDVCPVDDDVATSSFTAVSAASESSARVHRTVEGESTVEEIDLEEVAALVTERGDPRDRAGIDLVEIEVPSPFLPDGLTLVDTPGVGGLLEQSAAATLRFLRLADAVVFVTDASQELTAPEVDFLVQAKETGAVIVVAETKIDLYPAWSRIVDLDRAHLRERRLDVDVIPVSAAVCSVGRGRRREDLEVESGIPELLGHLVGSIMDGARQRAEQQAVNEVRWAVQRLLEPVEAELDALEDPERASRATERLSAAERRLAALQEGGARWQTVLNDGFTDLRTDLDHRLRAGTRAILVELDERIELLDPRSGWDELARWLQGRLASLVDDLVIDLEAEAEAVNGRIAELLLAESPPSLRDHDRSAPGIEELWGAADRRLKAEQGGVLSHGLAALRGGSSGTILLGMVARFAGIALATPVSLGVAVAFGLKQVSDVRRQELGRQRQEARTVARRFVDEVTVEVSNRTHRLVHELHRQLRDGYAARLQEMTRSAAAAVAGLRAAAQADATSQRERAIRLRAWRDHLAALIGRLPDGAER